MTTPEMTVAFVSPDDFDTLRNVVDAIRKQTAVGKLEALILLPAPAVETVDKALFASFHSLRVIGVAPGTPTFDSRALAAREATAPLIAYTEDHSFPYPDWAEHIIAAFSADANCAAVGVGMVNANPRTATSLADTLLNMGAYIPPYVGGNWLHLPWHNTAYRRAALLRQGDKLVELLDTEGVLFGKLIEQGFTLFMSEKAQTRHINIDRYPTFLIENYLGGRRFGAHRANHMKPARKLLQILGTPLVPLVRVARCLKEAQRIPAYRARQITILPPLLIGAIFHATGEVLGLTLGDGGASKAFVEMEFHRVRKGYANAPDEKE